MKDFGQDSPDFTPNPLRDTFVTVFLLVAAFFLGMLMPGCATSPPLPSVQYAPNQ